MENSRRDFLKKTALVGAGIVALPEIFAAAEALENAAGTTNARVPENEKIHVALIGCGEQGNVLLDAILRMNRAYKAKIVAVCDIWKFKLDATIRRLKANGIDAAGYVDFREMLARERSLDAVFIATPDFCHAEQAVFCLEAKKHVYCEKMLAENVENARKIVRAAEKAKAAGTLFQAGHQRRSNPFYRWAKNEILPANVLGRITSAFAQWNRAVSRDVVAPKKFRPDAALLKEFGYEDEHQFLNWRSFKKYSGGPISDLGAHQIDIFNWFLGVPESVVAAGGNDYYKNRECFDNVVANFCYKTPAGTVRATYQVLTTTSFGSGYFEAFMGDEGALRLSEKPSLLRAYQEPRSPIDWNEYVRRGILQTSAVEKIFRGNDENDFDARASASVPAAEFAFPTKISLGNKTIHQPHVENFFRAILGNDVLNCAAAEAFRSEAPIFRVNEAVSSEKILRYAPEDFEI